MSDDEENVAPAAAPPKSSKILPIMLVLNTLLVAGVLVFVMKRPSAQAAAAGEEHGKAGEGGGGGDAKGKDGKRGEKGEKGEHGESEGGDAEGPGPTLRLDTFIVQVRATEGDRYAHMTIDLELGSEADKKSVENRMPRVRDAVIGHLSDRTEDELRGSEGLGQLKEALLKKMEEIVPGHRVKALFVTEFIIQ